MIWLLALLWTAQPAGTPGSSVDPRIEWVELQRAGRTEEALASVDRALAGSLGAQPPPGTYYLRGRLLAKLGRTDDAAKAWAEALSLEAELEPWIRFRLAEMELARAHPEVAAGLLATLLGGRPEADLGTQAGELLARAIERGGDCRLLAGVSRWRLEPEPRRRLALLAAQCDLRSSPTTAVQALETLLLEDTSDSSAYDAAELLARTHPEADGERALSIARAMFEQRSFDRSLRFFDAALGPAGSVAAAGNDYATHYSIARAHFWLGQYPQAAARFASLPALTKTAGEKAKAFYQRARSFELDGRPQDADVAFEQVIQVDPEGNWAAAALVSRLRLAAVEGREGEALDFYRRLGSRRRWRSSRVRAALFLAAGDLAVGRTDRAGAWLTYAAATSSAHEPELRYWRGRLAELELRLGDAVGHYLEALRDDAYDPWSQSARSRLESSELEGEAARLALVLSASSRERDLFGAWLLSPDTAVGGTALASLRATLATRTAAADFMDLAALPTPAWPMWQGALTTPSDLLLAVGDWQFGAATARRHFPSSSEQLAFTRAQLQTEAGLSRSAIVTADLIVRRSAGSVPPVLWPQSLRKQLYPMAYGHVIERETSSRSLDPRLLAALIREESRFDPAATSAAAARGLTQFVLPTARRIGRELGLDPIRSDDLLRPEIAVQLGATYLAELRERFPVQHQILAGYNAGEPQSELWASYCAGDDPAEFLTKIGFVETRNYVRKVLRSYAIYRELYPTLLATTPGKAPSTSSK